MTHRPEPSLWSRWVWRPQTLGVRRALFQIHLWSGVALGVYVFLISVTGSVLVYRNELYVAATREPLISVSESPRLDDASLGEAAIAAYPGARVTRINRQGNPDLAVEIWLDRGGRTVKRLFDPRTGEDVGRVIPLGITLISGLLELHDDLLAGRAGRIVNGVGAIAVVLIATSGLVIWWPGRRRWRRSLTLRRGVGTKRLIWDLHSVLGFWTFAFIVILGVSGIYLCFPESFHALAERLQPITEENAGRRAIDRVLYWLAFLHFGRINGIGLFCDGPGLCDQATKAAWALFGLAPAAMFCTGALMWWNRVVRRWLGR